jgi:transketolase
MDSPEIMRRADLPNGDRNRYEELRCRARLRLLKMHFESGVGHIGGNLSCLDLLLCLYHDVLEPDDVFILSKGHSVGALYITLWTVGLLTEADLLEFHRDGTRLSGHPPAHGLPEIVFATGSLGHGLGLSAGLALGKRLKGVPGRVFCLMSDGEWNEGSCWESLIFIRQRGLGNLTFLVDLNGLQGFGTTREVADLDPLAGKLRSFGIRTREIDGHDHTAIVGALRHPEPGPTAIVARTLKGCGISFMEDRLEWHYLPLSREQYSQAIQEVEDACAVLSANHS